CMRPLQVQARLESPTGLDTMHCIAESWCAGGMDRRNCRPWKAKGVTEYIEILLRRRTAVGINDYDRLAFPRDPLGMELVNAICCEYVARPVTVKQPESGDRCRCDTGGWYSAILIGIMRC